MPYGVVCRVKNAREEKPPVPSVNSVNLLLTSSHTVPLLAPMVWVRKLKHYAVTNIIADILIVAPLMYIMSYEADMMRERGLGPKVEAFRWATCLPFFGTTVYSMEGISMIIPIEQSMKRKEDLPKVWLWRCPFQFSLISARCLPSLSSSLSLCLLEYSLSHALLG